MNDFFEIPAINSLKQFECLLADRFNDDLETLMKAVNFSFNQLLRTDLTKVKVYLSRIEKLFRYLPKSFYPRLVAIQARYAHWSGDSCSALGLYRKAIDKMAANREYMRAARTRLGLIDVYMYLGDYDQALITGKKALSYFRRKQNNNLTAQVLTNIGNIYHRQDRNKLALRYYDRARDIFKNTGGPSLALIEYNRANIYTNLNRLNEAQKLYKKAVRVFEQHNQKLAVAKSRYSLAYLYYLEDRYGECLQTFEEVYNDFKDLGDHRAADVTLLDMAEIDIKLNQYSSAAIQAEKVISSFDASGMTYEMAKAAYFAGEALLQMGDCSESEVHLKAALKSFENQNNLLWQGIVSLKLSRLALTQGKYSQSEQIANNARKLFSSQDDQRRKDDADILLAEILQASGKSKQVEKMAFRLIKRKLLNYQKRYVYRMLGNVYYLKEEFKDALHYYKQAIRLTEKTLSGMFFDEIRFFYALDKYDVYLRTVECLLKLGRTQESFVQHSKALSILNLKNINPSLISKEVPAKYLKEQKQLRSQLKRFMQLPTVDRRSAVDTTELRKVDRKLWRTERTIRSLIYPKRKSGALIVPDDFNPQNVLTANETLVSYFIVSDRVGVFKVNPDSARYMDCGIDRIKFQNHLRELHFLLEQSVHNPNAGESYSVMIDHYLRELYSHLIEPLDLTDANQRLIVIANGIFGQVPFVSLKDASGQALCHHHQLVSLIDPQELIENSKNLTSAKLKKSAIFSADAESLPLAEIEGRLIGDMFPTAQIYSGSNATLEHLKHELNNSRGFVHIATHAARDSENPLFSRILFGDGPFFPFDLYGTGIKAELVCLSGCQTAAPGLNYGNSFSLARAFYLAGTRYILASLWSLSDKVSMLFMNEFYGGLKSTLDVHSAYRKALCEIEKINPNPAFWSPFILLGK